MEIERQFLVENLPILPDDYEELQQGYVSLEPEIRIRRIGDSHFLLTVKRGAGLVREEWETYISQHEFENLAARLYPGTKVIEKRRYRVELKDGHIAELHVHGGHLAGFNYVEVEFSTVEAAEDFVPPEWFGREVTEDTRFSNGTLAREDGMELVRRFLNDR